MYEAEETKDKRILQLSELIYGFCVVNAEKEKETRADRFFSLETRFFSFEDGKKFSTFLRRRRVVPANACHVLF